MTFDYLKGHFHRIARKLLVQFREQKGNKEPFGISQKTGKDWHSAVVILLQSFNALGSLEIMKQEFLGSREHIPAEVNAALRQCISTFQELRSEHSVSDSPEVKAEYLSCLRRLYHLISNANTGKVGEEKEINDEIRRVEGEISDSGKA